MYKNKFAELFLKTTDKKLISNNINLDIVMIFIIIFIILMLVVITYNNTLEQRLRKFNNNQLKELPKELEPIEKCNNRRNYRLMDYYIASSYNTASIGTRHYDYVSTDAVKNTLLQGARYIQLNVFSLNVNVNDKNDEPVIGTSTNNDKHITSLNSVPLKDVLEIINAYAFKVKANKGFKAINYPLIIDLTINTHNIYVLNKAAKYFNNILGEYLLKREKYINFPIQFEYLCNLTNKIILWVNGNILSETELSEIAIPKNLLIQKLHIAQITNSVLNLTELEYYLRTISKINIKEIYKNTNIFEEVINALRTNPQSIFNFNTIKDIINLDFDSDGVINKLDLENKLIFYNTIGMTLIEPNEGQVYIENYDIRLPFNTGCQIMAMAYQNEDDHNLKIYKKIFEKSSFILKPANTRIPDTEQVENIDLLEQYDIIQQNVNIPDYFIPFYDYNYGLIYLQEIVSSEYKYANISAKSLKLSTNKLTNTNYLLIKKTEINGYNAFYILNPLDMNLCLTIKNNYITNSNDNLEFTLVDNKRKQYQTFIIEKPLKEDNQYIINNQVSISIRSVLPSDTPYYLSTRIHNIVLKQKNTEKPELMTFNSEIKPAVFTSEFTNLLYGNVKVFTNGFVGIGTVASKIELIYDTNTNINNGTSVFMKFNDRYLCLVDNKLKLSGETRCSFILEKEGADYFIRSDNMYLTASSSGILEFKEDQEVIQEEKRDERNRIIQPKRVGPKLGSEKYFSIKSSIKL